MKQLGEVFITFELLADFLKLPDRCKIEDVLINVDSRRKRQFSVIINSPKLPQIPEGTPVVSIPQKLLSDYIIR